MDRVIVQEVPVELAPKAKHHNVKRKYDQQMQDLRQGSRGLKRPTRPLSFQTSGSPKDNTHHGSTDPSAKSMVAKTLEKRIHLIDMIVRRNKNQHRNQLFFKDLCLLRTSLAKLSAISSALFQSSQPVVSTGSSEQVRRSFEVQASLRSQKDVLEGHVREVLVPKCYVTFTGLVGDSQFGNLGVVLVALLSEIACGSDGVGGMRTVQDDDKAVSRHDRRAREVVDLPSDWSGPLLGTSTRMTGEDQGEIVERVYDRGAVEEHSGHSQADQGAQETPQKDPERSLMETDESEVIVGQSVNKTEKESKVSVESTKALKKSKKSQNTIDDLFSGLF